MSRRLPSLGTALTLALVLAGCHPQQPFYFGQRGELAHYRDMATEIEYPDVNVESLPDAIGATQPFTLSGSINGTEPKEPWELTLEEAMHIALCNAKVMRTIGAALVGTSDPVRLAAPDSIRQDALLINPGTTQAPTVYDTALYETGVEAALAAFDAQLSSSLSWEKKDTPINTVGGVGNVDIFAQTDQQDQGTFQAELRKTNTTGGTAFVRHNVRYTQSNSPLRQFPSDWQVNFEAEVRQPLLQGAGVTFNRIAGPGGGIRGGVVIARINVDIQLANFEAAVRNMVSDVENAYWELYYYYRAFEAAQEGLEATLRRWQVAFASAEVGVSAGNAATVALTQNDYYTYRAAAEQALADLYKAEESLRYMMGIATADGRMIRPADEPTTGKVSFDWYAIHNEALCRNTELRARKWRVKQAELELVAAKNFLLPRLDAVARYRWLGLGDDMIGQDERFAREFAYNEMLDGNYQEWALGLDFRMPLGFRKEMADIRNAQLRLARERAVLQEQELELSHQLGFAFKDLDSQFVLIGTNYNRRLAAEKHVKVWQNIRDVGAGDASSVADSLSRAQREWTVAITAYYRSLVNYNRSITLIHTRKGSLLEYNNVYLAEGPWPQKAYFDAGRLARSRDAAIYMDYGMTLPRVISRGPMVQHTGEANAPMPAQGVPTPAAEVIPTPAPTPTRAAPTVPVVPAKPQALRNTGAGAPQAAVGQASSLTLAAANSPPQGSTARAAKGYDLGQMNLEALGQRPGQSGPAAEPVRQVNYQEPAGARAPAQGRSGAGDQGWTNAASSSAGHEGIASLPRVEADRSTPGWARTQH